MLSSYKKKPYLNICCSPFHIKLRLHHIIVMTTSVWNQIV